MRILAAYRHFWPDSPPYATMLRTIAEDLARAGHDVTVLCEQPSYKAGDRQMRAPGRETVEGVTVCRLSRLPGIGNGLVRRLDFALFPIRVALTAAIWRLRGRRFDVVWTATVPPALNGWGVRTAARLLGARFVYHFQDIYPELQTHAGNWRSGGLLDRLVGAVDRANVRAARAAIVLSEDMADTVAARGVGREKLRVINNFMIDSFADDGAPDIAPDLRKADGRIRVIFAGNIGRFQGLEAVVEAARLLAAVRDDVEFLMLGEGAALEGLRRRAEGLPNVRFAGHLPFDRARPVIESADLGLVSLQPGIFRTAYPSKTLTYLGLGVPVLAVVEPESQLARTIAAERLGYVAAGREPHHIADAVASACAARADMGQMRRRARDYYDSHLSRDAALAQWRHLMNDLERP